MSGSRERPCILVVEDDEDTRRAMRMRLRASGYDTVEAADTSSAIATARAEQPDVILLDLGLPGGGGLVVLRDLTEPGGSVPMPVVVLSARDAGSAHAEAMAAGAFAYVEKLVDNATLLATIRDSLAHR